MWKKIHFTFEYSDLIRELELEYEEHDVKIMHCFSNYLITDQKKAELSFKKINYIEEVLVWLAITEDVKNDIIKINIRSRGPIINTIAERYNGGGHKMASGAKVSTMDEAECLIQDLDYACQEYLKSLD